MQKGVAWPSSRFTVDGTGLCVTDNLTGLMWVRIPIGSTGTWQNALTYANGLTLCGYTDWRLPNVNELESLVNAAEADSAAWLNNQNFINVLSNYYWASSTYAYNTPYVWSVNMWVGTVTAYYKTNAFYVWPVRAGQ